MKLFKLRVGISVLCGVLLLPLFVSIVGFPTRASAQEFDNLTISWINETTLRVSLRGIDMSFGGANAEASSVQGNYVNSGESGPRNIGDVPLGGGVDFADVFQNSGIDVASFDRYEFSSNEGCVSYIIPTSTERAVVVLNPFFGSPVNACAWTLAGRDGGINPNDAITKLIGGSQTLLNPESAPTDIGAAEELNCESQAGSFGWIMCPTLALIGNSIDWIEGQMISLLSIDRERYDTPELEQAWRMIRNLAYLLLVPMFLVMVISTAMGFEFISAYTVKKALPRMIIATIFIALSYEVTVFLVDFVQAIGHGVQGLMLNPFNDSYGLTMETKLQDVLIRSDNTGGNVAATAAGLAGYGAAGYFVAVAGISAAFGQGLMAFILGILGVALLVLFMIFLLLTFRQLIVVMLILLAPLAILSWIFPGRDKLFGIWNKTFWLMMWFYPLIMLAVAAGKILAVITVGR